MPFFSSNTSRTTSTAADATRTTAPSADNKAKAAKEAEANVITSVNAPDVGSNKAAREFEHGRQRAKKTERTANYRAEKAYNKQTKAIRRAGVVDADRQERKTTGGRAGGRGIQAKPNVRADDDLDTDSDDTSYEKKLGWEKYWTEGALASRNSDEKVEIDLTAIMQPAKVRKSKAGDFEVVPAIRGVVVLDDRFSVDAPMEIDEPWECIDAEDDVEIVDAPTRRRPLTYADVLR